MIIVEFWKQLPMCLVLFHAEHYSVAKISQYFLPYFFTAPSPRNNWGRFLLYLSLSSTETCDKGLGPNQTCFHSGTQCSYVLCQCHKTDGMFPIFSRISPNQGPNKLILSKENEDLFSNVKSHLQMPLL